MSIEGWSIVASFGDRISALALVGLLESEKLPCLLNSNAAVPGLGTEFAILVPTDFLAKARRIVEQAHVSERELTYLATGEGSGEPEES
jgi:Putative prokaryotic signal transducing protein